jgi:beta-lactamase regulating signal transducer with metallopeptidase domain
MISAADLIPFANHLWQSTLFVVAVWVLTLALQKNRAAVRHRLWLAASIKFLIPFSLLVSLGARIPTSANSISAPLAAVVETISEPFAASYPTPVYFVPADSTPSSQPQQSRIPAVLVSLWFFGFVLSLLWWARRWRQVRRAAQEGTPLGLGIPDLPVRLIKHAKRMEPGVFGILRPILLLPDGITECLSADELQSVIAHELCHVRRRDNLATAVHMIVEALFWFHPLVWWIKARLLEEQERACDEEVLTRGANPQVYAESILNICKLYLNPPLTCVAGIAGSNLKRRIETIMQCRIGIRLSVGRKALLTLAAAMALVGPIAIGVVQAREDRAEPQQTSGAVPQPIALAPAQTAPDGGRTGRKQSIDARAVAAAQAVQATLVRGTWEIENPAMVRPNRTPFPGRIQLTFDGSTGKSFALDSSPFRGLTSTQIASPVRTTVQFEFESEAGKFVCEGEFEAGVGKGRYVLYSDAGFLREMATLGFTGIQEQQLVSMALHGVGPRFLSELRSAGITSPTFDQLMGMRAVGVTGEYIRAIQEAGYSPNADELITMWVQEVTPEFANQIRQLYPAVSPTDLIGMRVNGVGNRLNFGANGPIIYRSTSVNLPSTWTMDATGRNGAITDRVQLRFFSPGGGLQRNSFPFDSTVFRGLTAALMMSETQTPVQFDLVRDAGTFVCEGYFLGGRGSGTSVFQPNLSFRAQMLAMGFQDINDRWLFAMALHDVNLQFARERRQMNPAISIRDLVQMKVQTR